MKGDANYRSSFGFTIVELLVVIVVIGILAAITIVSYTGITNWAVIASIQSDLTNASTALKMDQTLTDSFPTTLALANSGKGITPSQTMDSIIYVPDNISNPKNFCLQYRKGTNTYAIDNNSQPAKGVCLTNLITNSNFVGTTGWSTAPYMTVAASNNELSLLASAIYAGPLQIISNHTSYRGHKLYFAVDMKLTSTSNVYCVLNDGVDQDFLMVAATNVYQRKGGIRTISSSSATLYFKLQDGSSSGWQMQYIKNASVIDLTAAFGSGNEPTQAQMDTIMTNYPNSWFNIVAKANL